MITPVSNDTITDIFVGRSLLLYGYIFTGRDAVLPKLVRLIQSGEISQTGIELQGAVIFHTAVSPAGIGPTSSNKFDIESSIPVLSEAGVKIHIGKGKISQATVEALHKYNSIYAVIPPVSALLTSKIKSKMVVAFPEEGMEAMYRLEVEGFPAIVAVAHGETIWK